MSLYNAKGGFLRSLPVAAESGAHSVVWDGRDRNGNVTAPGCYIVTFTHNAERVSRTFALTRSF